jgi:hypothetical protein
VSWFHVSLRLNGNIEILEVAAHAMEDLPFRLLRKGERYNGRRRAQPQNVLLLDLAEWERGGVPTLDTHERDAILADEHAQLADVAVIVQRLAPNLAALDRPQVSAELYISKVREEDTGGFGLPAELIAAAAMAHLSIGISIGVAWSGDENAEDDAGEAPSEIS